MSKMSSENVYHCLLIKIRIHIQIQHKCLYSITNTMVKFNIEYAVSNLSHIATVIVVRPCVRFVAFGLGLLFRVEVSYIDK